MQVFFTTTRVNTKVESLSEVQQSGTFALDAMSRLIRGAVSVEIDCDSGNTTTSSAMLTDYGGDTTTFMCVSDGTAARVASVSGEGMVNFLTGGALTTSLSGGSACDDSTLTFACPVGIWAAPVYFQFSLGTPGVALDPADQSRLFQTTVDVRSQ